MRLHWLVAASLVLSACAGYPSPTPASPPAASPPAAPAATYDQVKAKFSGLTQETLPAGYIKVSECVNASELPPPVRQQLNLSETAVMGFHYTKPDLFDDGLDPLNPEDLLLFDANGDGRLEVVGVEYEANANATSPKVFGQPMALLPQGHPGMNFPHYVLHVWFVPNPAGTYSDWNPALKCPP